MSHSASRTTVLRCTVVAAVAGGLLGLGGLPAAAHTHPTPVDLDSPAVVFIQTRARVDISLIEHNRAGKHIGLTQRSYSPVLTSGSGFSVNPSGAVVTSPAVITPDLDRARIFAVNSVFNERYGGAAPLPADPFARHTVADLPDDPVNGRLQSCYRFNTADNTGGCVVAVTPEVLVYPYVTSQEKFGGLMASVLAPVNGARASVAVLRVGASSMPTVDLGQTTGATKAISEVGFTAIPSARSGLVKLDAHFTQPGNKLVRDADLPKLVDGIARGVAGGPVIGDKGQVIGMFGPTDPASGTPGYVDAAAIRSALSAVQVSPLRGPTDHAFENAMHGFKNSQFTASIPSFQNTLALYPGHFTATANLAVAQAKKGTAADVLGSSGTGTPQGGRSGRTWLTVLAIVVPLLALLVLGLLLLRRRRARRAEEYSDDDDFIDDSADEESEEPADEDDELSDELPGYGGQHDADQAGTAPAHDGPGGRSGAFSAASGARAVPNGRPSRQLPVQVGVDEPGPPAAPSGPVRRHQSLAEVTGDGVGSGPQSSGGRSGSLGTVASTGSGAAPRPAFCTECGQPVGAQQRFCGWCGHLLP